MKKALIGLALTVSSVVALADIAPRPPAVKSGYTVKEIATVLSSEEVASKIGNDILSQDSLRLETNNKTSLKITGTVREVTGSSASRPRSITITATRPDATSESYKINVNKN